MRCVKNVERLMKNGKQAMRGLIALRKHFVQNA
jgi:hypothetical protein